MTTNGPTVSGSAALHAQRIKASEAERAAAQPAARTGQSTAERYAQRILPGYKADAAARERARLSELRSRGLWTPLDEEDAEEVDEAEAEEEFEEVEEDDVEDDQEEPKSTAELYAARERQRIKAEHEANIAAWRGSSEVAWRNSMRPI
ncbi:hypothetical protein [Streptomyces sp. NPDC001139]